MTTQIGGQLVILKTLKSMNVLVICDRMLCILLQVAVVKEKERKNYVQLLNMNSIYSTIDHWIITFVRWLILSVIFDGLLSQPINK